MNTYAPLLQVDNLYKSFSVRRGGVFSSQTYTVQAVNGVSFSLEAGTTLGIVGESGCGKSTLGRTIMGLYRPTSGAIYLRGKNLSTLPSSELHSMRKHYQMIFQDPYASLNPRLDIFNIIAEPLRTHKLAKDRLDLARQVKDLMDRVGLPAFMARRYPHEFSGGQRQRIAIARAIAIKPDVVICDEPVSALDVSIQAQIINLLQDLQRELGLAYIFISHDIGVVRHISHRVLVMYLGKVMEEAAARQIFTTPAHPYTQALLSAVPFPDPRLERERQRIILQGELPSPANLPAGCLFQTRCAHAFAPCFSKLPDLATVDADHRVACYLQTEAKG